MEVLEKSIISCPCGELNLDSSIVHSVGRKVVVETLV